MRTYYIYKGTNKINGKSYIGQTCDFKSRVWQHLRCYEKEDCLFHGAIQKYGRDNFSWEIIETCETEKKQHDLKNIILNCIIHTEMDTMKTKVVLEGITQEPLFA